MTNAEIVARFGEHVWGQDWPAQMERFTRINERTLRRIYQAARHGEDYPAARGVLGALSRVLASMQADLAPWVRAADADDDGDRSTAARSPSGR